MVTVSGEGSLTGTITAAGDKMLKIKAGDSEASAEEKTVYSKEQYAEFAVCVAAMVGKSLSINGDTGVNFYLKLDSSITENGTVKFILPNGEEEELKISEAGNKIDSESGAYKLSTAVAAAEMAETIGNWTMQYSPLSYVKKVLEAETETRAGAKNLMKALYYYNQAANTYFAN